MKLTKDQKELLQSLVKHPWWTIVEQIEIEAGIELWKTMRKADLSNENHLKILRENQIYCKAREDFIQGIKKQTIDVYTQDIKLF